MRARRVRCNLRSDFVGGGREVHTSRIRGTMCAQLLCTKTRYIASIIYVHFPPPANKSARFVCRSCHLPLAVLSLFKFSILNLKSKKETTAAGAYPQATLVTYRDGVGWKREVGNTKGN